MGVNLDFWRFLAICSNNLADSESGSLAGAAGDKRLGSQPNTDVVKEVSEATTPPLVADALDAAASTASPDVVSSQEGTEVETLCAAPLQITAGV